MPIYEYRCEACGHELEKIQKISEDPLKDCPECGEASLVKLISKAAFRLKGTGWYETDFKGDKKKKADGDKKGGATETTSKDDGGGDSKGDSKKDSAGGETKKPAADGGGTSGKKAADAA